MYKLTQEQSELLKGKSYDKDKLFNPVQDKFGDWFISDQEVKGNTNWRYRELLASLEQSEYIPPVYDFLGEVD